MPVDVRLYALIDPEHAGGHDVVELARLVAGGGATLVQLRDKSSASRSMVERARALETALKPFAIPFLINDRVDVALACNADGVHVGQEDMAVEDARRLLGDAAIIGLSLRTPAQAEAAPIECIDYVGVGGIFATASKENPKTPIGLAGLSRVVEIVRRRAPKLPICGIAGITAENAAQVIAAGADGVAVISALAGAREPQVAAGGLRSAVDIALQREGRA